MKLEPNFVARSPVRLGLRVLAATALSWFAGCADVPPRSPGPATFCRRVSLTYPGSTRAELSFTASGSSPRFIVVHLGWLPNPDPAFYTPRGVLREASVTEGGRTVHVPAEHLRHVEDLWPELVRLVSVRPGDYRLYLPQGAGSGPSHPDAIVVRGYRFVGVLTPAPEYADEDHPHYP